MGYQEILKLINETSISIKITTQNYSELSFQIIKTEIDKRTFSALLKFNSNVSSNMIIDEIEILVTKDVMFSNQKMKITLNKGEKSKFEVPP